MTRPATRTAVPVLPSWLGDAVVEIGPVHPSLPGHRAAGVLWRATDHRFLLEVPGVARYEARDGRSLRVDPAAGARADDVAGFARSTPLAALCHQRGMLALHAATAAREGAAVLLAGDSGAGKSTLLAELLRRGWQMLGDDLAPLAVDEHGVMTALPTHPELVLWPDAAARLRDAGDPPGVARGGGAPRAFPTDDRFVTEGQRVRRIWWLSTHNRDAIETETLSGAEAVTALTAMSYNSRIAGALLAPDAFLRAAGALARSVPLRRVRRTRGQWRLAELADRIEAAADELPEV